MSTMSGLVKVPKISLLATALLALVLLASHAVAEQRPFNLGQIATAKQVAGWDIDVRPDGLGAPVGAGNAFDGEEVYENLKLEKLDIFKKTKSVGIEVSKTKI